MDRRYDRLEVIVEQNDVAGVFGDLRARAHCDADMRVRERGDIVDAVARHSGNIALLEDF